MRSLENILEDYKADIEYWMDDFGEGHLFLEHRKQLIPFEDDKRVVELDKKALQVIDSDQSRGNDKLFLEELRKIIDRSTVRKVA